MLDASDPLIGLGLVDPKSGSPVQTSDWSPADTQPDAKFSDGEPQQDGVSEPSPSAPATATPQPVGTAGVGATSNESSDAPILGQIREAQQAAQQDMLVKMSNARLEAAQVLPVLIQQGMPKDQAEALVQTGLMAFEANLRTEAQQTALMPVAKLQVAMDIAAKNSNANVKIDPQELLTETSPNAMIAKAQTLATQRRDNAFNQRRTSGVDAVESGAPAGTDLSQAYEKLGPLQKIRLGIMRGQ